MPSGIPQLPWPSMEHQLLLSNHLSSCPTRQGPVFRVSGKRRTQTSQVGQVQAHMEPFVPAAAQQSSSPASNSTPSEAVSELKSWKKRGEKRNIWTVNHVEGTKLRMNKRRRPSYRPEDQEAFYRLLGMCSELVACSGSF